MADLRLQDVSKVYPGPVHAVRDLNLHVADGEFMVLVGPSGCGKSTVLRLVAGLEEESGGSIHIGGRLVNRVSPKDRDIAMVFQNYALYPHMSVRRNLSFGLRMRRVPRDEIARRVSRVAELLGLADLLERKPRALSGGQQQRVAVGRAIVREPQVFLFDEPLSNLDARLRLLMRGELRSLHARLRTTTVYVTHDQEEAMTLGERLAVLSEGRLQQVGRPLEIYRRPANSFVAGFVGSPPINFIQGEMAAEGGAVWFTDQAGWRMRLGRGAGPRRPVVLGLRPEGLRLEPGAGPAQRLALRVLRCEPVGDRMDLYGTAASGVTLVARVPATEVIDAGAEIELAIDPAATHVFEPGPCGPRIELERDS